MKDLKTAWETLQNVLDKKAEHLADYEAKIANLNALQEKLVHFIQESEDTLPVMYDSRVPFESWKTMPKTADISVLAFRDLRDNITRLNSDVKKVESEAKEHQSIIGNWLLQQSNQLGLKSLKTEYGTAFKQLKIKVSPADWDGFLKWAAAEDAGDAIQKRVNAAFVNKYNEMHDGENPPFLNVIKEYEIVIRKS